MQSEMDRIDRLLAGAFPDAESVVTQDRMQGFRPKPGQHILLVEVVGGERPGPYVVKVGPRSRLAAEVTGWESCRPLGLRSDLVFLPLSVGASEPPDPAEPGSEWMCLIYGDAQQLIAVGTVTTLEDAVLGCVRFGVPHLDSVLTVLEELFVRVGHLFYSQSYVDDPAAPGYELRIHRLPESLDLWASRRDLLSIRTDCDAIVPSGLGRYLDPACYLAHVTALAAPAPAREPGAPTVTDVVPKLLRGCAHGDLHGRNVLVGIVRERALWPTVFDYEDMGRANLIGWDFAKMETELKSRAYPAVFRGAESAYIAAVAAFEADLNGAAEECQLNGVWPACQGDGDAACRLRSILLLLRQIGSYELGANRGRGHDWLDEYYFLLSCYGLCTARFPNLQRRERLATYLSAGAAAARLSWPRRRLPVERRDTDVRASELVSYLGPLEAARTGARSGDGAQRCAAADLLHRLRQEYPFSVVLAQEHVLALLECDEEEEAERVLREVESLTREPSEELLCRWGRMYKANGDRHATATRATDEQDQVAARFYQRALRKYEEAYRLHSGHYPGVNVATLHLIVASLSCTDPEERREGLEASARLAAEILERRSDWTVNLPDDEIWHAATEAEANLLLRNWQAAAASYQYAQLDRRCQAHHVQAMRKQAERIVQCFGKLGVTDVGPLARMPEVFGLRPDA